MTGLRRRTWRNHTGNQACQPLRICAPGSVEEVVELVRAARADGVTARAVGSGHSWSDCALTGGYLLETHGLAGVEPHGELRADVDPRRLVRVRAGTRLRELNAELGRRGQALANMGGYDAQTVAGVLATSTHGSGLRYGPIADFVRSLDLVAGDGRVVRIEPDDGPTDPAAFAAARPDWELRQRDDDFHAVVVGIGCFGVVVSAVLEVEPSFCLEEQRWLTTWEAMRERLRGRAWLEGHEHAEVYVSPYARRGRHLAVACTRDRVACGGRRDHRNRLTELLSAWPLTPKLGNLLLDTVPALTPWILDRILRGLRDPSYVDVSYRVLNIGAANLLPAYSAEIGVPLDGRHLEAVESVLAVAERQRRLGSVYATAPIALRFVRASPAFLSMMHGRDTMMIELILMTDTEGGFELLAEYEAELYALSGRPHWGQVNRIPAGLPAEMYPRFEDWQAVRQDLDPDGVFDGPFPRRVGISTPAYAR
jgi:L-gulono-1,4-lactone dehydrogenase